MVDNKPTALGMELGAELRRRREIKGLNGREMAHKLGWHPSKVSRLETGVREASEVDVAIYLATCQVSRADMDRLLDLAREAAADRPGYRLQTHGEKLPDELRTLIFHETNARTIASYEPIFLPGLLQTEDFTRALLEEGGFYDEDAMEFRVQARMDRQSLLNRPEPHLCTFYIHEHVLRTQIGSARIMHEQVLHLVFQTARAGCEVLVVPTSAGGRGLAKGAFRLMAFDEIDPVVYVEQEAASLFVDDRDQVSHYRDVLRRLDTVALDEGQSRHWLASLATEYDRSEDDRDA